MFYFEGLQLFFSMLKVKHFDLAQAGAGHPQARLGPQSLGWWEDIHSPPDAILLKQMEFNHRPTWVGATGGHQYDGQICGEEMGDLGKQNGSCDVERGGMDP